MKTKCLIIDDEPLARALLRRHIEKLENFEIVAECPDAMKALQVLYVQPVDLMFLDIQMPQITGLEFLRTLKNPPKTIITTAFREYALDGFELEVIDYLLKPITFERFLKSVNKYYQMTQAEAGSHPVNNGTAPQEGNYLYVKENKKVIKVFVNEILYIEGQSEYIKIHTTKKRIITKASLTQMEEKLPSDLFIRIHKSFIVNVSQIESFTATSVDVPGKELPIGRNYKDSVMNFIKASGLA
jgi:DNA-binding LytR/AlgR family response regulator